MNQGLVKIRIIQSLTYDPWYNLALEEYLLDHVESGEVILYLWQNENTVVIGKHQNAWKECRWEQLKGEGGKLARRLSGGGAVFHDLGNVNFTFVADRKLYDLEKQLETILRAVRSFSIHAQFSGRNDLVVDGKKFSGNAFYFKKDAAFHHGTILLDADFGKLGHYLQVSKEKITSKGIDSVQSRVVNLKTLNDKITISGMKESLINSFAEVYGAVANPTYVDPQDLKLDGLYEKYASWDWIFGRTPVFDISYETRFSWGGIEVGFNLKDGFVESATIYSDAMNERLIDEIPLAFRGVPFKKADLVQCLDNLDIGEEDQAKVSDVKEWIIQKEI